MDRGMNDEKQDLLFGAYISAHLKDGQFIAEEIGLFYRDGHPDELRVLKRFTKDSAFELGNIQEFRRKVFLKYLKAGSLIVAYDAPFEISRIAVKWNKSVKRRRAFSFYFRLFQDKKTGTIRPSGFEPGIAIESLDASKAIYRLIKYKFHEKDSDGEEQQSNIHILDLKTLTGVITGEAYTLSSACEIFGAPASRAWKFRSRVTKPAIECLLKNVTGELELLNRLRLECERHPVDLVPERCYSPATLAKEHWSAMGITPPQKKFNIPDRINGIAMQALVAGRAECVIRRTPLPVTYVDVHAQFPAVSKLLNCREILCAESLEFRDFTAQAREILERTTRDDCFRSAFWKQLRWYALVEPQEDVVPIRAKFGQREDSDPTMGWNFLTSKQPVWMTGPDVIAAKLMTGKRRQPALARRYHIHPAAGRVHLLGGGVGRIFAAGDWLGAGCHAGSQVDRRGTGDGVAAAASRARIGAPLRSGRAVCGPRLCRFVRVAPSPDQHVAPRQSLGQRDL